MSQVMNASAPTAILVLGMHRSGTSATTRVLNLLGAELGSNLLDPQSDNLKGFWEHHGVVQIHERLLSELGRDWFDLRELPSGWLELPACRRAIEEIVELIRKDFAGMQLWAVKDPRMCRLAPLWIRALNQLDIRATALIVLRDPREVAASLHVRDGWSYAHSWLMWGQHVLESIEATQHIPRAMLDYDSLMKDWASNMARIGSQLHIAWPHDVADAGQEIEAFLTPSDRHHQAQEMVRANSANNQPPSWLMQLVRLCSDVAAGQNDWSAIASLHSEFQAHAQLFAGPIAELTQDRKVLQQIAMERLEVIAKIQDELAAHSHHLKGAMAALQAKSSELETSALAREDLQQALSAKSLMADDLERALGVKSLIADDLERALGVKSTAMDDLCRQYENLSSQHRILEEYSHAQHLEQARIEEELAALQQARLQLKERLENARVVTLSRRWLLRRITQLTFQRPSLKDVEPW